MSTPRTYIQQLRYDGMSYTKGDVVNLKTAFGIECEEMPFTLFPKSKDFATRDWAGSDGVDIYVPNKITLKEYDIEAKFIYQGTEATIHNDIKAFVNFLYGRNSGAVGGRLAIYDEHVKIGRKDVVVTEIGNELYHLTKNDTDAIARFKVKFKVCDPVTDVVPTYSDGIITAFTF